MGQKVFPILFTILSLALTSRGNPPLQIEPYISPLHLKETIGVTSDLPSSRLRLPLALTPTHYDLTIQAIMDPPEGEDPTAPSTVRIHVDCGQNTTDIKLHSNLLVINETSIKVTLAGSDTELTIDNYTTEHSNDRHFFTIIMEEVLVAGSSYEIYIEYIAPISTDRYSGLYMGDYYDPDTQTHMKVAGTQMEPTYARQLLPCFDEPQFKSTFSLKIAHSNAYHALANGDLVSSDPIPGMDGWVMDTFETTPLMPTYLLAITISQYEFTEAHSSFYPKKVRTYAAKHFITRGGGNYSADHAARMLSFFERELILPYPMTKMDSAALPNFTFGAMENFGLNIYRVSALIALPGQTTERSRYGIDAILGHELAHQWTGNIVTCKYWHHIWLNEGFATYFEYKAVKEISPEFNPEHRIVNEAFQYSMQFDVLPSSHPIIHSAETPDAILAHFDRISYEKGGSIIRMMEGFLGMETLKRGIQHYLNKMQFQVAVTDDLWDSLNLVAHEDQVIDPNVTMKQIMDTWTLQKGFPLVRISKASEGRVYISQEKFMLDNRQRRKRDLEENQLWHIPISFTSSGESFDDRTPNLWLESGTSLKSHSIDTSRWFIANTDSTAYFRVMYDAPLLNLIKQQLATNPSAISPISRSQLLDDNFNLAFNSYTQIEDALDLTSMLADEDRLVVWNTFFTNMRRSYTMFSSTETFDEFRKYLLPFLDSALAKIGPEQIETEVGDVVILRGLLYDWACSMGSDTCMNYTKKLFDLWEATPESNPIPIDLRGVFYCSGITFGSFDTFEFLLSQYKNPVNDGERTLLVNGLACTKDVTLLRAILEWSMDETNGFQKSDGVNAIQRVAASLAGRKLAFDFFQDNVNQIVAYFGPSVTSLSTILSTFGTYYNTESELSSLEPWIDAIIAALPELEASLRGVVDTINGNLKWMDDFHQNMKNWLISKN